MKRMKSGSIRVVIAEDHAIVLRGLVEILRETPDLELTGKTGDGGSLLTLIREQDPDVVVMDINMPVKSGWDVMLQLKSERPRLPVVVLSISPEEDYALKFFQAGAAGYLTKATAPEQLVDAIRKVARGGKYITPALAERLAFHLEDDTAKPVHEKLSPREFQVFCLIAGGKTVSEIAGELSLSPPTISTHRARILEKMRMKTNAQLTRHAYQHHLID
ncbi:MAG: response regulator [Nitrospinaceae bacterium]